MENKVIVLSTLEEITEVFTSIVKLITENPIKEKHGKIMTRQEAAKFCRMSYHSFGNHVRSGRFTERGVGRKKFFYEDELIQALNNKK